MHNFTLYNLNYVRSEIEEKKVRIFSDFVPLFTALDSYLTVKVKSRLSECKTIHFMPFHIINPGTGIKEKFPPFPLFIYVSLILPMLMLSQKSQCRHESEETICTADSSRTRLISYSTIKKYSLYMPLKSFTLSKISCGNKYTFIIFILFRFLWTATMGAR
jgi:hypothetical protein